MVKYIAWNRCGNKKQDICSKIMKSKEDFKKYLIENGIKFDGIDSVNI